MPRWSKKDTEAIAFIRKESADLLEKQPPFVEVVGDRRILRFVKGHPESTDKALEMFRKFLVWRAENGVDEMRQNILLNGMDHPTKFPHAQKINEMIPCISMAFNACDKSGSPICVDQYDFNPSEVLAAIKLPDYVVFATYGLEYKTMILDQMAEEKEMAFLASLSDEDREKALDPFDTEFVGTTGAGGWAYEFLTYTCVIRDMGSVGWKHLAEEGRTIIKAIITLASDNYPELLGKCIMINSPWVFNTTWPIIKTFLAPATVKKIDIVGSTFMDIILENVDEENIPEMVGGTYKGGQDYEEYNWNKEFFAKPFVARIDSVTGGASVDGVLNDSQDNITWRQNQSADAETMKQEVMDALKDTQKTSSMSTTEGEDGGDSSMPAPPSASGDTASESIDNGDTKPPQSPSVLQNLGHA